MAIWQQVKQFEQLLALLCKHIPWKLYLFRLHASASRGPLVSLARLFNPIRNWMRGRNKFCRFGKMHRQDNYVFEKCYFPPVLCFLQTFFCMHMFHNLFFMFYANLLFQLIKTIHFCLYVRTCCCENVHKANCCVEIYVESIKKLIFFQLGNKKTEKFKKRDTEWNN